MKKQRGSEWRIWDLHIHTPESICQEYKNTPENWEKFISSLENLPKEVKVIGITDYYFIDGFEKVIKYKKEGRLKNIDKIFPILEFRIDTFGSGNENRLQKINLHILFDLDESKLKTEITKIKEEFIQNIKITPLERHKTKSLSKANFIEIGGNLQAGFDSLVPSTKEVLDIIKSTTWKDKTFLFLGYKEWSNLEKNQQLKPLKDYLYNEVKAFFSNNIDTNEKNQRWLNEFGSKKLLHSLDIHSFKDLDTYQLDEEGNIKPFENYHCHTWIKADTTFNGLKQIEYEPNERVLIQQIKPQEKAGYQVIDSVSISHSDFTKQTLYFNQNLTTIIGGRSTGKSVLLGSIAKKLNSDKEVKFDNADYTNFVNSVVSSMIITWKDGINNNDRNIEYFPQSYMYRLAKNNNNELDKLVEDIIKQNIEKKQLISDYESFTNENNTDITNKINKIFQLKNSLTEKQIQLKEKGDEVGIKNEIDRLTNKLLELKQKIKISDNDLDKYNKLKLEFDEKIKTNEILQTQIIKINSLKKKFFINSDIDFELVALNDDNKKKVKESFLKVKDKFQNEWDTELDKIVLNNESIIKSNNVLNNEISTNPDYISAIEIFQNNKQFKEVEEKLKIQQLKLSDILVIRKEVNELVLQISNFKSTIQQSNRDFYNKIEEIKDSLKISRNKLKILAHPNFNYHRYKELLNWSINQQSYQGKGIVNSSNEKIEDFFQSINDLFEMLLNRTITLKGGNTHLGLALKLMATNFFDITYEIQYEDTFNQMSEGKKAFVVLMLLLDFSKKDCPILIDQPEDDLDNRAIYSDLVKYLKSKKKERQIIVVTHNPNIVVGADAELIIVANQNGSDTKNNNGIKFQYTSGSIENSKNKDHKNDFILESQGIKEHVCEILEGGNEAFKQRERKYNIK